MQIKYSYLVSGLSNGVQREGVAEPIALGVAGRAWTYKRVVSKLISATVNILYPTALQSPSRPQDSAVISRMKCVTWWRTWKGGGEVCSPVVIMPDGAQRTITHSADSSTVSPIPMTSLAIVSKISTVQETKIVRFREEGSEIAIFISLRPWTVDRLVFGAGKGQKQKRKKMFFELSEFWGRSGKLVALLMCGSSFRRKMWAFYGGPIFLTFNGSRIMAVTLLFEKIRTFLLFFL